MSSQGSMSSYSGDTSDEDRDLSEEIAGVKADIALEEKYLKKATTEADKGRILQKISDMKSEIASLQASLDKLRGVGGKRRRARKTRKAKKTHKKRTMKHRR